jgi:hypothetical protein
MGYHVVRVDEILPATQTKPERRHVSQALLAWPRAIGPDGMEADLRRIITEAMENMSIEVLDRRLCGELPHFCEPRSGEATSSPTTEPSAPPSN